MAEESKFGRIEEVAYKCQSCNFVVYKKKDEKSPEFCPNCAITHLKGDMIRVEHV